MLRFHQVFCAATLGLVTSAMGATITVYPTNNGFELPDLGSGGGAYEYGNVPTWTAFGGSGEAANGSGFNVTGATNGNGAPSPYTATSKIGQAAFLQGGDGGISNSHIDPSTSKVVDDSSSVSQIITLPAGTTSATLDFSFEGRGYAYGNDNGVVIYVNGSLIPAGGTVASPLLPTHGGSFTSQAIALPVGSPITITFAGDNVNGGDSTTFIDNVSIAAVTPEPASIGLVTIGAVNVLARRRRL